MEGIREGGEVMVGVGKHERGSLKGASGSRRGEGYWKWEGNELLVCRRQGNEGCEEKGSKRETIIY